MEALFAAVLGVVQGISEFLPISSSGHLLVAEKLLGLLGYAPGEASQSFAVMLHMGTLLAVFAAFFPEWLDMLRHPVKNRTLLLLFLASLPALVLYLFLNDWLDAMFGGWFLGIAFLVTAAFLALLEIVSRRGNQQVNRTAPDTRSALTMGAFQAVALMPGVSRSGATLLGGVLGGLTREAAARFSFMMSAPAILGSFLSEGKDALEAGGLGTLFTAQSVIGLVFAAVTGWFAIRFMLRLIRRMSFWWFAAYVAVVGVAVLVFQLTGFAGFPPVSIPAG
jgi:undecaprenyl-diphosphatase